jgi:hypothetical protein
MHLCGSLRTPQGRLLGPPVHSANVLLQRCIVPKIGYSLELLPPHLVAESAAAAHKLVVQAYCDINDTTSEEAAAAFDRGPHPSTCRCA